MYAARVCSRFRRQSTPRQTWHLVRALASAASRTPFVLADIGEGIAEVEVMQWHVKKGDVVKQFQPLVEVQSDKATVEITSRYAGVVDELSYGEGDIARVGEPLCFIVADGDESATGSMDPVPDETETNGVNKLDSPDDDTTSASYETAAGGEEVEDAVPIAKPLATPAVRGLAQELGVSLASVRASGPGGRVTKEDVQRHARDEQEVEIDATDAEADPVGLSVAVRTEPVRGLQRVMVRTMTAATGVPHLGLGEEVLVDKLVGLVQELKRRAERMDTGTATPYLSLTPFFIKAASLALLEYPILNSILSDDCEHIHFHAKHNFGLAVDTAGGLAVPQIKGVEELSVAEISDELRRLKECAKTGKFDKRDMEGTTTFTLSNVGSIGGTYASPVIPRPQVAIAALGRVRITPRFDAAGKLYPASVLHVSLSCDHRIIDGGTAARFCNAFRDYLENPECMLLHLK